MQQISSVPRPPVRPLMQSVVQQHQGLAMPNATQLVAQQQQRPVVPNRIQLLAPQYPLPAQVGYRQPVAQPPHQRLQQAQYLLPANNS